MLPLYDENAVEIAWVRTDPYEFEITHPDSGWDRIAVSFGGQQKGEEAFPAEPIKTDEISGHSVGTFMTGEEDLDAMKKQLRHVQPETSMKSDGSPAHNRREALGKWVDENQRPPLVTAKYHESPPTTAPTAG